MVHWVVNEAHVVNTGQQLGTIDFAVGGQTAHTHAAKVHAVVALFSSNEDIAVAFPAGSVVGQGDLQGGVGGFRTRVAKKHLVQIARAQIGNHLCGLKGLVVADLKGRGVVEGVELFFDGFGNGPAVVTRAHTPQARNAIDHLTAIVGGEVNALSGHENARLLLEMAIACEGQPLVLHVEGGRRGAGRPH